jgi:acyl carrier protein
MTTEEIREKLLKIFDKMNLAKPSDESTEIALDSLSLMMFVYEVETAFGVKFGLGDMDGGLTLARLTALIASKS